MDYFGLQLDDEKTGKISRNENYLTRYKETLLNPYVNSEFRIKRMLEFLNVTGYRTYAIEFVNFFEREIFKPPKS